MKHFNEDRYCTKCGSLMYCYAQRDKVTPFNSKTGEENYNLMAKCPNTRSIFMLGDIFDCCHNNIYLEYNVSIKEIAIMNGGKPLIVKQ